MFYSLGLTNLKTADSFSVATRCKMTKIEDTTPVHTSRATGPKHQLSETARENTSNQAYLTNSTKEQSSYWNASYIIITFSFPQKFMHIRGQFVAHYTVARCIIHSSKRSESRTLHSSSHVTLSIPQTVRGVFSLGKNVVVEVFQLVHFRQEPLSRPWFCLCFEQLSDQHGHLLALLIEGQHLTQEQHG